MNFGHKDTLSAAHAYTGLLTGLKLGQGFVAKLNYEFATLIIELFKILFESNSQHRIDEFFDDFQMFKSDMIRKYSTTSPYGYSPRSPMEKRLGLPHKGTKTRTKYKLKDKALDECNETEVMHLK